MGAEFRNESVGGYGGYGGFGGGYGCGLEMLLVIALLGGGGLFGNRHHGEDDVCKKQLDFVNNDMNSRFNNLQNQMDFNGVNGNIGSVKAEVGALAVKQLECCCQTQKGLLENKYELTKSIAEMQHANDLCCCTTNRNIDTVKFQNEKDTCAIIAAIDKKIDGLEKFWVNDKLRMQELELQKRDIVYAMKPQAAVPAYIQPSPYEAYYPQNRGFGFDRFDGRNHCFCGC